MSDITLRLVKGLPLTNQEVDDNFANLNTDKYQAGDSASFQDVTLDNMSGPITWNVDDGTVDVPLNAQVTLQLGQEFVFYAKATEAIANGDVVMFAGAQGGHLLIAKCDMGAAGFDPSHIVGIATQSFATNDFGYVTSKGKVRSLDTSGFAEGAILYVDPTTAGGFTATKPAPPNHIVQVAAVTRSHATQGTVLTRVSHMPDTDEVPEGSTNLYFTDARAVSAIKADGDWNASNWDTAYGWGDHSTQNYAATTGDTFTGVVTLPQLRFDNLEKTNLSGTYGTVAFDLNDGDAPTDLGTYGSSYPLGLYVRDADGVISTIYHTGHFTGTHISNWNTAYGWGDHSTQNYATQTYVNNAVSNLVDSSPSTLDTLNELAAALGDDPNFATTVTNSIGTKVSKSGDTITSGNGIALTLNHNIFGNGLVLHRNDSTNAASIVFKNNTGQGGILYSNNSGELNWRVQTNPAANRVFHDTYHPNADKWTTARTNTVTLTGDASGSGSASVDGTGNWTVSVPVVVNNDSHTHDGRYYTESESDSRFLYKSRRTGCSNAGAGWYRIARSDASSGRGSFQISFFGYGGSNAPQETIIRGTMGYGTTHPTFISIENARGSRASKVRGVQDDGKCFIEVYMASANTGLGVECTTFGIGNFRVTDTAALDPATGTETSISTEYDIIASGKVLLGNTKLVGHANAQSFQVDGIEVINSSRNLTNIGTITTSGRINAGEEIRMTSGGNIRSDSEFQLMTNAGDAQTLQASGIGLGDNYSTYPAYAGAVNTQNGYRVAGTVVIDSSRNASLNSFTTTNKSYIDGGHSSARLQIKYRHSGATSGANNGYLTLWSSEPGITYYNTGIGGNIHDSGQYYGRQDDNQPYGVYLRFNVNDGYSEFWSTTGSAGVTNGKGSRRWYVDASGNTTQSGAVNIASNSPVLVLKDLNSTGASQSGFISLKDKNNAEKGWMGYGSTGDTDLTIRNSLGRVRANGTYLYADGYVNTPYYQVSGTTIIDSGRNLTNIANVEYTGSLTNTNTRHEWRRSYVLNNTTPKELLYKDGNSLPNGGVYRFSAHISGTGTDNWATAVYWNQNGSWKLNVTQQSGTSSNNPEFIISGGKPTLHIDHSSNYTVHVFAERLELSEGAGTDNNAGFGADAFMGSVGQTLRYNPNGGASNYDYGWNVFHDAYHPNADKWTTARTLSLTGDASGSVSWDGSANASLSVTVNNDSHTHDGRYYTESEANSRFVNASGDTMSGQLIIGTGEANPLELTRSSQVGIEFNDTSVGSRYLGVNGGVLRFGGNLNHGVNDRVFTDAYHPNADKWTTARSHTVTLTGDVTGSATQSVDGTGNRTWTVSTAVANDSHTHDGRYYTESESDSRFVNVTGDTMTGNLVLSGAGNAARLTVGGSRIISVSGSSDVVWQNLGQLRLSDRAEYDWDDWGGIKYESSTDTMHIGGSSGGVFSQNSGTTATINFTGVGDIQHNGTTILDASRNLGNIVSATATNMYVGQRIYHNGDTNTYINFSGDDMQLVAGGRQMLRMDEGTNPDRLSFVTDSNYTDSSGNWRMSNKIEVGSDTNMYFTARTLSDTQSGDSYNERVVLLAPKVETNSSYYNTVHGKLQALKTGGNVSDVFDIFVHSVYNDTRASFTSVGQRDGHKLVTCTYNGIKWVALKFAFTANPYNHLRFHGMATTSFPNASADQLRVISYYDTNGGGVLNSEVYNSIADYNGNGINHKTTSSTHYFTDVIGTTNYAIMNSGGIDIQSGGLEIGGTAVIDNDHNAYFDKVGVAGKIQMEPDDTYSGYYAIGFQGTNTANGVNKIFAHGSGSDGIYVCSAPTRHIHFRTNGSNSNTFRMTSDGNFQVGNTTVIDSGRVLTNIVGLQVSGTYVINSSGSLGVRNSSSNSGLGLSLYGGSSTGQPTYGLMFAGTSTFGTYGGVTGSWATYFTMNDDTSRGWIFKRGTSNVASIDGGGDATFLGNVQASNGWVKSGSGGFYVSGNQIVNSSRDLLNIGNITCSGTNNTYGEINIREDVSSPGYTFMRFQAYSTGNTLGSIYRTYGSMYYSTSSDYRLKENVVDLTSASARVNELSVKRFNFIEYPGRTVDGFLAHEVAAVVPEAVIGEHNEVDEKGNPVYQSIDQSKLVPLLTAALQEALTKIEQLETRVNALENGE